MSTYTETMRRWASDTRRAGTLPDADGTGEVGLGAEEAGRRLAVRFSIRTRDGRAAQVRYQVFGCGFTMAACAAAAELAEGRLLEEVRGITAFRVDALLEGLPPERGYCADLAAEALHAAVAGALGGTPSVQAVLHRPKEEDHAPPLSADDSVYLALMGSSPPPGIAREDRHLFACLLAAAAREPHGIERSLGLTHDELASLLSLFFPGFDHDAPPLRPARTDTPPPEPNADVLSILLTHVPKDEKGGEIPISTWLAHAIAARAARPGHLWVSMGLFERPELTAAIRRHLPTLAEANRRGMRWKRFLYKEVCDRHGAILCKAPDCGVCSDYEVCFGGE